MKSLIAISCLAFAGLFAMPADAEAWCNGRRCNIARQRVVVRQPVVVDRVVTRRTPLRVRRGPVTVQRTFAPRRASVVVQPQSVFVPQSHFVAPFASQSIVVY